jgi:Bacterial Ig domain
MKRYLLALVLACAALSVPGVVSSGADFTAASSSTGNAVTAAANFNTIVVSMTDPGSPLHGTVVLASTSSSDRGITSVTYEAQLGAGAWTPVCSSSTAPYSCSWDTTSAANGTYSLHAIAFDASGRQLTSAAVASRLVDNQGPIVSLADPGTVLTGTKTLTATATDAGAGVASVSIYWRRAGTTTWNTLCTGATSPKACGFDTTAQLDGDVELRAGAVDNVTNSRFTSTFTARIDNHAPTVTTSDPGSIRGVASLSATVDDGAGTGVVSVTVQARANGTTTWTTLCTDSTTPYACSLDTTTGTPDGLYDIRATALDGAGFTGTSPTLTRRVDNTAPSTPTLTDPGTMSATKTLTGTAADAGSGVASWKVQYRTSPSGTWTDACTDSTAPFASCTWDTTTVADGLYDLRAITTDVAGNTATSATLSSRRVDNLGPTVVLNDPGAYLRGTKTLSATASDGVGVQSVAIERKATAGSTWTTICTDNTSSYSCSLNTTTLADGLYDFRAKATDTLSHVTYSAIVSGRAIDNTAPTAVDVQTGNGGAIAGRPEANDWISFTWSEQIAPATILAAWTGTATPVRVTFTDSNNKDTLAVYDSTGATLLGITDTNGVALNGDYVTGNVSFDASMVQTGATVKITFTAKRAGGTVKTAAKSTMKWNPATTNTDLAGNTISVAAVTESGVSDLDF